MNSRFASGSLLGQGAIPLDIRHLIIEDADNPHPSAANGLHQVARNLILEQLRAGDAAQLFYVPADRNSEPPADVPLEVVPVTGRKLFGHPVGVDSGALQTMVRDASPSTIFHIHGFRRPLLIALTHELRRRHISYVITGHSRYAHIFDHEGHLRHAKTAAYVYVFERPVLQAACFVHLLTTYEVPSVRRLARGSNIEILPNGAFSSAREGVPAKTRVGGLSGKSPVFGFFGRLAIEHKGLDLLVEGFAHYRQAGGEGTLEIMGTGDEAQGELAARCDQLGIAEHTTLLGPRFGQEKIETLKGWDFFVMPSRFDRVPLAGLEAGLFGLPLILTAETGLDAEQSGGGITIQELSSAAVAAALSDTARLSSEQWSAMSESVYQMVLSVADWTAIAAKLRELYLQALVAVSEAPRQADARQPINVI